MQTNYDNNGRYIPNNNSKEPLSSAKLVAIIILALMGSVLLIILIAPSLYQLVSGSQNVHSKGDEIFNKFSTNMNCTEIGSRQYVNQSIDIAPRAEASFDCKGVTVSEFLQTLRKDSSVQDLDAAETEFYSAIKYNSMTCNVRLNRTNMERMSTYALAPVNLIDLEVSYCK